MQKYIANQEYQNPYFQRLKKILFAVKEYCGSEKV
ncbi:hypothetical protein SAMN05443633_10716 [Chryseobacterium arachidis]|uniref:Uncharacterized protein n=1 Tax=Chryseobacterium arachidis TaxID=1416778 RepID=A0A1M5EPX1_9FLAO|nr:hypothetical protein SAMN05443633_10716 [Chryseobacterium arachidis]